MLSVKPGFSLSSFTLIKRLFSFSSLSAIWLVSSAYLRLLIFLMAVLIPACDSSSPAFKVSLVLKKGTYTKETFVWFRSFKRNRLQRKQVPDGWFIHYLITYLHPSRFSQGWIYVFLSGLWPQKKLNGGHVFSLNMHILSTSSEPHSQICAHLGFSACKSFPTELQINGQTPPPFWMKFYQTFPPLF